MKIRKQDKDIQKETLLEWHPEICGGQLVIRQSRIMVNIIFDLLHSGESDESIIDNYPTITTDVVKRLRWIYDYCVGKTVELSNKL